MMPGPIVSQGVGSTTTTSSWLAGARESKSTCTPLPLCSTHSG